MTSLDGIRILGKGPYRKLAQAVVQGQDYRAYRGLLGDYLQGNAAVNLLVGNGGNGAEDVVISSEVVNGKSRPLYIYGERVKDVTERALSYDLEVEMIREAASSALLRISVAASRADVSG